MTLVMQMLFNIENGWTLLSIIYLASLIGWAFMVISSLLMLFNVRLGYYLIFICWILNLPNLRKLSGLILYAWLLGSYYLVGDYQPTKFSFNKSEKVSSQKALKDYISMLKNKGYSKELIEGELIRAGYKEDVVNKVIK